MGLIFNSNVTVGGSFTKPVCKNTGLTLAPCSFSAVAKTHGASTRTTPIVLQALGERFSTSLDSRHTSEYASS